MNHPMGPLTWRIFIGLDVCLDILRRIMHEWAGDPKYRPCPLLIKMVDAGLLRTKDGRGLLMIIETRKGKANGGRSYQQEQAIEVALTQIEKHSGRALPRTAFDLRQSNFYLPCSCWYDRRH